MKQTLKALGRFTCLVIVIAGLQSCSQETINFDEAYLYGTWKSGTLYEKYLSNGTGKTWDTSDDVSEDEAQSFTWTLITDQLTQIQLLEMGGSVPKVYNVITLTASQLVYEDNFGKRYSFTKVN